jgi:hypothetical protein
MALGWMSMNSMRLPSFILFIIRTTILDAVAVGNWLPPV